MSNKKLATATIERYGAPLYPEGLEKFQRLYETRKARAHPVSEERLEQFANDLQIIAQPDSAKYMPNFVTEDGTEWTAVKFRYVSGNKYILAFPKHEDPRHRDGTVSAQHVALYSLDDEVSDKEIDNVLQAAYSMYTIFH